MNVETGTEAALFPEKEYINGIFLAVCTTAKPNPSYRKDKNFRQVFKFMEPYTWSEVF